MKKTLYTLFAILFATLSCSDDKNTEGNGIELPEAPASLVGDYYMTSKTAAEAGKVASESYISLYANYSGVEYDSENKKTYKLTWTESNDVITLNNQTLGNAEAKVEDKIYKDLIAYNELSFTRSENGKNVEYKFVKSGQTAESPLKWDRYTQHDEADAVVSSMNNNNILVEIQQMKGRDNLIFGLGKKQPNGNIDWITISDFGRGSNLSIAYDDEDVIVVSYTPQGKEGLWSRVGLFDKNKLTVTWGADTQYATDGINGTVSLTPSSKDLVASYQTKESRKLNAVIGKVTASGSFLRITWGQHAEYDSDGDTPSIAIDGANNVIAAFVQADNKVAYTVGLATISTKKIEWGSKAVLEEGLQPSIAINNRKKIMLTYKIVDLPFIWYQLGDLDATTKKATFNKGDFYGVGSRSSVSINDVASVLEVRQTQGSLWYYSTKLDGYTRSWMAKMDDNTSLADMSIPGTHDTAARYGGSYFQCHTMFIHAQLDGGIRFMDIRCKNDNGVLKIYHSTAYQFLTLDDVVNQCINYFNAGNNKETVIISIKNEGSGSSLEERIAFEKAVNEAINKNKNYWHLGQDIPKLGEVRNKIVLMRRFDAKTPIGIDVSSGWNDSAESTINSVKIQDIYDIGAAEVASIKWPTMKKNLDEASAGTNKGMLYLNFGSANSVGATPINVANGSLSIPVGINTSLLQYFDENKSKKNVGCVIMDFPSNDLIDKIIDSNF